VGDGFGLRKDFKQHSLLTASEEVSLSRQYKLTVQILSQQQLLSEELGRPAESSDLALSLQISKEHMTRLLDRGAAAKNILVRCNMRLVFSIVKLFRRRGATYPDLVQEGTVGLMKAVDKYDPERGFRFSTYAAWWIKQSVSRAITERSRIIRLPEHILSQMRNISRAERECTRTLGRKPTTAELADSLGLPLKKIELLIRCGRGVYSIDETLYHRENGASTDVLVRDRIASEGNIQDSGNGKDSIGSDARLALNRLSEKEAEIIEMRFGLDGGKWMSMQKLSRHIGVSEHQIGRILTTLLAKMRSTELPVEHQ
jgi:RNA polymerase nonessential primary-like sigma factor